MLSKTANAMNMTWMTKTKRTKMTKNIDMTDSTEGKVFLIAEREILDRALKKLETAIEDEDQSLIDCIDVMESVLSDLKRIRSRSKTVIGAR